MGKGQSVASSAWGFGSTAGRVPKVASSSDLCRVRLGGVQAWDRSNARGADGRWESKEGRLTLQFIAYTSHGASYV